jgi:predicted RNA-binding protein YlxR (DUF448 family)
LNNKVKMQAIEPGSLPQRSCVACRDKKDKRDLIRLVYDCNIVVVDISKKKTGRGAYLCPSFECWDLGLRQNRLEHVLHIKMISDNRQALLEYAKSLPKKEDA